MTEPSNTYSTGHDRAAQDEHRTRLCTVSGLDDGPPGHELLRVVVIGAVLGPTYFANAFLARTASRTSPTPRWPGRYWGWFWSPQWSNR